MTKEVLVKIKGKQSYPEGEAVESVTEVDGEYYFRNGAHYILFEETEAGFTQSTRSMLKVRSQQVELTKKGLIQSHMLFEEGSQQENRYHTPFGVVPMEVRTKHIRMLEEENSMLVQINYALYTDGALMADCDIRVQIKSKV